MKIKYDQIGNSTYTITINEELKFALDPALAEAGSDLGFGIKRKTSPVYNEQTFSGVDFWLITHLHGDHLDELGMEKMEKSTPVITHEKYTAKFSKENFASVTGLAWKEVTTLKIKDYTIQVKAVPAYHGHSKLIVALMQKVNGYMVEISKDSETKTIYVGSDTVFNEKVKDSLSGTSNVDLFIATAGAAKSPLPLTRKPITMTVNEVSHFSKWLNASKTIVIHIDDYSHFTSNREEAKKEFVAPINGEILNFEI
jgi:L-ascorbate metabolism protein UlaG (beta-lactamase superfamily)